MAEFIGCSFDSTILFRVDSVQRSSGTFENVLVPLTAEKNAKNCMICGRALVRVAGPVEVKPALGDNVETVARAICSAQPGSFNPDALVITPPFQNGPKGSAVVLQPRPAWQLFASDAVAAIAAMPVVKP